MRHTKRKMFFLLALILIILSVTVLVTATVFVTAPRVVGDDTVDDRADFGGRVRFAESELTINASGAISVTHALHGVDTLSDASTDDLSQVNGGVDGNILILYAESSDRTVVVKDSIGNLILVGGDFSMDHESDQLMLAYNLENSQWYEIARSDNGTQDVKRHSGIISRF